MAGTTPGNTGLWPSVTPVLLIPVVGNVLAPLAGVPQRHRVDRALATRSQLLFGQREVEPDIGAVQRVPRGQQLLRDLAAVGAFLQQLLQPTHLTFGAPQAVHQLGPAFLGEGARVGHGDALRFRPTPA
jgi:hypothetical protein